MASSLQHQQHITAANQLSEQSQRGTLGLAYRKSVMSLQSLFGWKSSSTSHAEREPLLDDQDGATAGPSYGSVLDLPPERRVPKPKIVKSPVRVEAKVWFANEVGCRFQEKSALSLFFAKKNLLTFRIYLIYLLTANLDLMASCVPTDWIIQSSNVQLSWFLFPVAFYTWSITYRITKLIYNSNICHHLCSHQYPYSFMGSIQLSSSIVSYQDKVCWRF